MELSTAFELARATKQGVLVTLRGSDGRPQLSNIFYAVGDDDVIRISITADRAKYANIARSPWAALHVTRSDFFAYAVIEADAALAPIATDVDDDTVAELVELYRSLMGEHDDWDTYRTSMVTDRRTVLRLHPTRAYGLAPSID